MHHIKMMRNSILIFVLAAITIWDYSLGTSNGDEQIDNFLDCKKINATAAGCEDTTECLAWDPKEEGGRVVCYPFRSQPVKWARADLCNRESTGCWCAFVKDC